MLIFSVVAGVPTQMHQTLSPPAWVLPGVIADFDFANQRYWQSGQISAPERLFVFSRNNVAFQDNQAGIWTQFPTQTMRVTDKGVLSELLATNNALFSRDMTSVNYVDSNITPVHTATGIDGVANAASTLTATAGNGTALQSVTLASAAYVYSAWVRRRTGTGNVDMTIDNGTTWTTKTLTSTYQRFQVIKTAANPVIGFRIVTSGDAIDVDFNQLESGSTATSPITTVGSAVARPADVLSWRTAIPISNQNGVVYVEFQEQTTAVPIVTNDLFQIRVDSNNSIIGAQVGAGNQLSFSSTSGGVLTFSATSTNPVAADGIYRAVLSYAASNFAVAYTASLKTTASTQASGAAPVGDATGFGIGGSAPGTLQCGCYIRRLAYSTVPISGPQALNWAQQ